MFKYYFLKTLYLVLYLSTAVYCWYFMLAPVIAQHGFWKMLAVIVGTFIVCFLTSALFFITRKPQATLKHPSWTTAKEYQEYFDSINVTGDIND